MKALHVAASLVLAAVFTACDDQSNLDETGSAPGSALAGGTPSVVADTIPSPLTSPDLSDANIVDLLDHASDADSSAGALASTKATNPLVKRFARMMMTDHHRLRTQGADLAGKLGLTPQPLADDPITPLAQQGMDALQASAKGVDFDRTYIGHEVATHRTVLDLLDQAREAAGNADLRTLIERSRPLIESHLKQAETIEKELGAAKQP